MNPRTSTAHTLFGPGRNWAWALIAGYSQVPKMTPVQKKTVTGLARAPRPYQAAGHTALTNLVCLAELSRTAQSFNAFWTKALNDCAGIRHTNPKHGRVTPAVHERPSLTLRVSVLRKRRTGLEARAFSSAVEFLARTGSYIMKPAWARFPRRRERHVRSLNGHAWL